MKRSKKPLHVFDVLGKKVPVYLVDGLAEGAGALGRYHYAHHLIEIDSAHAKTSDFEQTLMHELAHAFAHRAGLHQAISRDAEEMFCESFSFLITENFSFRVAKTGR